MKRIFTALLVAALLLGIAPVANAQVDLIDIKIPFRNVLQNRVYGFDFYGLLPGTGWSGELRGKYGHVLADSAVGWAISGAAMVINAAALTGSNNVSGLTSGTMYVINANGGGVTIALNAAPSANAYVLFSIGDDTNAVTVDVAVGGGTDYSLWGADRVFPAAASAGRTFALYQSKNNAGQLRWAISDPRSEFYGGTLGVGGLVTASSGVSIDRDNYSYALGASGDYACVHDGTDTTCTTATGDFFLDNTDTNDQTVLRLGTDTAATGVEIRNNSDVAQFTVLGSGQADIIGNLDVTGGVDIDSDTNGVVVGASADCKYYHNGTNSYLLNATGSLVVQNADSGVDSPGRDTYLSGGIGGTASLVGGGTGGIGYVFGGAGGAAAGLLNAGTGGSASIEAGAGGAGSAAGAGTAGAGGITWLVGGTGGAGGAAVASGAGGNTRVYGGAAGVAGGAGTSGNGGNVYIRGGNATAPGTDGLVYLADDHTSAVYLDEDSVAFAIGEGQDYSCVHDGTDTVCTTATGDFYIDNTDVNDQTILRLGTDTTATAVEIRNDSNAVIWSVNGAGNLVTATGYRLTQTLHFTPTLAGACVTAPLGVFCPQNLTNALTAVRLSGLKTGDIIQGYTVTGGYGAAAIPNTTTVTSRLYSAASLAGGATLTALGAGDTTGAAEADGVLSVLSEAALAVTVAADTEYYILIDTTTANNVACDVSLVGADVVVDQKL
jgi:hypothetical protein